MHKPINPLPQAEDFTNCIDLLHCYDSDIFRMVTINYVSLHKLVLAVTAKLLDLIYHYLPCFTLLQVMNIVCTGFTTF